MNKPAVAATTINARGPKADACVICLPLQETGTVATIDNIGKPRNVLPGVTAPIDAEILDYTTGLASTAAMGAVEGGSIDLGTTKQLRVWYNSGLTDISLTEFEGKVRFTSALTMNTTTAATLFQTRATAADGRFQLQKTNVANRLALRLRSGGTEYAATWTVTDLTAATELRFGRDADGNNWAALNGVVPTYDAGFQALTQAIVIPTLEGWTVNKGTNPGQVTLLGFDLWSAPLDTVERRKFDADTYLMLRPAPAATKFPRSCARASIAHDTWFDVPVWTLAAMTGTTRIRVVYSTTIAGLDSAPTVGATWATSTARDSTRLRISGLAPGTIYYWRIEESPDGTNWYPLAGGFQKIRTRGDTPPRILWAGEGHFNDETNTPATQITPKYGRDIGLSSDSAYTEDSAVIGKQFANYASALACYLADGDYEFGIDPGDGSLDFMDNGWWTGDGQSDTNEDMLVAVTNALEQTFFLDTMCGWIQVLGNHGCLGGNYSTVNSTGDAVRKMALDVWLMTTPNHTSEYGGIGEIGTSEETNPPYEPVAVALWATGVTAVPGDIVRPTVENGMAYRVSEIADEGSPVTTTEPTWSLDPNAVFASGDVYYVVERKRHDQYTVAAFERNGELVNTEPRRTWFAFQWGGIQFFIGDTESYSLVDYYNATDDATDYDHYSLGDTQTAAFRHVSQTSGCRTKMFFAHRSIGGENFGTAAAKRYNRSTGWRIGYAAYYTADGQAESAEEITHDKYCAMWGWSCLYGHDHSHTIARSQYGTIHVRSATIGASSHAAITNSAPTKGWLNPLPMKSKGDPASRGNYDQDAVDLYALGLIDRFNGIGYQEIETHAVDGFRVSFTETALATKPKSSTGYLSRTRFDVSRLIGTDVTPAADRVSLIDALNPTPKPLRVAGVYLSSNMATLCGSGQISDATAESTANSSHALNLYDPINMATGAAIAWDVGIDISLGKAVYPTVRNGLMAICTTAGATGLTEPTWPTVVGGTVTDGTAAYVMRPVGKWPTEWLEYGHTTSVPVVAGTSEPCQVLYVPRKRSQSDWLQSPMSWRRRTRLGISMAGAGI